MEAHPHKQEFCRNKQKKYWNVLLVSKKAVPLHSQFRGMAFTVALRGAEFTEKTTLVGEVAELVDALL